MIPLSVLYMHMLCQLFQSSFENYEFRSNFLYRCIYVHFFSKVNHKLVIHTNFKEFKF